MYKRLNTSLRDFPWDFPWDFNLRTCNFLESDAIVYLEMHFFSKAMLRSSADIRKQGYFLPLVRGCSGSQLSKGFEVNEDILRYFTVHKLINACFLICI